MWLSRAPRLTVFRAVKPQHVACTTRFKAAASGEDYTQLNQKIRDLSKELEVLRLAKDKAQKDKMTERFKVYEAEPRHFESAESTNLYKDDTFTSLVSVANPVQGRSAANTKSWDGCQAAAHAAYGMSDDCFIFPITPSSTMAELAEAWSVQGVKNVFGVPMRVSQLQSEGGAAGAVHGSLAMGGLSTTFTASQGLLLMIPNMYKIAGELMPCVFHIAARALAGEALSIFGDHQDVMAVRQTGWAMLSSHNVQHCQDLAVIAHLATLKARVPFVHFFDGFRTSHEINSIETVNYKQMWEMMDQDALAAQRARGLSPSHPVMRGSNQNPDVYMQCLEASNSYYEAVPGIVEQEMERFAEMTGRQYQLFEYYGAEDAEYVVVQMGAGVAATKAAVDVLAQNGFKAGVVMPHLYRPWSAKHFLQALDRGFGNLKRVAVLDRTKEPGGFGEPLLLDVIGSLHGQENFKDVRVIGGRWGLGSKEYTPGMALSVFQNLMLETPKQRFTVGINDDVTHLSLPVLPEPSIFPDDVKQCMFWGLSGDGTVGANKNAIKIIGKDPDIWVQGYFHYSSIKAGGPTISHLRFGSDKIDAPWFIGPKQADYVACCFTEHITKFDMAGFCVPGGIFVLNCPWSTMEELEKHLPTNLKKTVGENKLTFYVIDANQVAEDSGMGKFTNNIMQTAFFRLSEVLPFEEAMRSFKEEVVRSYSKRGDDVVQKNLNSVDMALEALVKVDVPYEQWGRLATTAMNEELKYAGGGDFLEQVVSKMNQMQGDDIAVSKFPVGGVMPLGTAAYEKRNFAPCIPEVDMDTCTQCNYCSYACPHAVIRPFLLSQEQVDNAPPKLDSRKATSGELAGYNFRIQVSALDCTGCAVCVKICPDDSLRMIAPAEVPEFGHVENWNYLIKLDQPEDLVSKNSVKGSQFHQPLLEFHGACAGCGETPYVTLLTQLFGDRMVIANATGCSSIWGLPYGSSPYTTNAKTGKGIAWANSLFEDNAEFGFGMTQNMAGRRDRMKGLVARALEEEGAIKNPELYAQLSLWLKKNDSPAIACRLADSLQPLLEAEMGSSPVLRQIYTEKDTLPKLSQWIIGGDGWAFDIGFGGLDHVLASGADLNILILDTEVYSNTGGQRSKATPMAAIAKFATGGKTRQKKDVGEMAMSYGDVYVASIAMGANMNQTLKAFIEADSYRGTSLILSYAPCIEHKIKHPDGLGVMMQGMKNAVDSGYWPLYRYNPMKSDDGKNPFELDAKKLKAGLNDYLKTENRFDALRRADPKLYARLEANFARQVARRHAKYLKLAEGDTTAQGGEPLTILYGSETGTTEALSVKLAESCRARGYNVTMAALDDLEVEELAEHKNLLVLVATCGEGALPQNCQTMWENLNKDNVPPRLLEGVNYSVFALGDRNYHQFCKAGYDFDGRFAELGGVRQLPMGIGDDQDEDKFETGFSEWLPPYWTTIGAPKDPNEHLIVAPAFSLTDVDARTVAPDNRCMPPRTKKCKITFNDRISPRDHDRSIRYLEYDMAGTGLNYLLGDALNVYPVNDSARVGEFLKWYGVDGSRAVQISPAGNGVADERKNHMFEKPIHLRQAFEEVIDIFGRPSKGFIKELAKFATDPKEKADMEHLLTEEGSEKYAKEIGAETLTFEDLLRRYPSAKPSVEHLLTLLPCIKCRLYTIASSSRIYKEKAQLTVVINDWQTPSGKVQLGTATDYMERVGEQKYFESLGEREKTGDVYAACSMTSGTFKFPESNETPMVMVGLGTGVAPFIAFAQDRQWRKEQRQEKNGTMWLFYGCRNEKKDYILGDVLNQLNDAGIITDLRPAFSRDGPKKIYVQHRLVEEPERIYQDLIEKGGFFYLCGQAGQLEIDIKNALVTCFEKGGGVSREEGQKMLENLMDTGRYCVELY